MNGEFINGDCMIGMKDYPDNHFDLAIVDPPYGIGRFGSRIKGNEKLNGWDSKPTSEYFLELRRVSKHQIIWGANNFNLPTSEYFIIWDKMQTVDNFASAEYAYTNVKQPAKVFRYSIHQHNKTNKIHPTQKPVAIYKWLLHNYATPPDHSIGSLGDLILSTHVGSASDLVACEDMGFRYVGYEIDKDYYDAATKRLKNHISQLKIF